MSLEFLFYAALATAALISASGLTLKALIFANNQEKAFLLEEFVSKINTAIAYGESNVLAFLPNEICNLTDNSSMFIKTDYGTFYFIEPVAFNSSLCPGGNYAELKLAYANGTTIISKEVST